MLISNCAKESVVECLCWQMLLYHNWIIFEKSISANLRFWEMMILQQSIHFVSRSTRHKTNGSQTQPERWTTFPFFQWETYTHKEEKFSHPRSGSQHLLCLHSLEQLIIITYVWSVEEACACFKAKFCVGEDDNFGSGFFSPWRCAKNYIFCIYHHLCVHFCIHWPFVSNLIVLQKKKWILRKE